MWALKNRPRAGLRQIIRFGSVGVVATNEAEGDPDGMLPPGTRWADIPDDWVCPSCGTAKAEFDMIEI
jgi:rubredoxin